MTECLGREKYWLSICDYHRRTTSDINLSVIAKDLYLGDPNNDQYKRDYLKSLKRLKEKDNLKDIIKNNYSDCKRGSLISEYVYELIDNVYDIEKIVYHDKNRKIKHTFRLFDSISTIFDNIKLIDNYDCNITIDIYTKDKHIINFKF